MNQAATIMRDIRAAGGIITVNNGKLKLSAPKPLPPALLDRVREAKPILLSTLQSPATWDTTDWREYFNERAGVAEYDGGAARENAERMAYEACIVRWLDTHPAISSPHICPYCQQPSGAPGASSVPVYSGQWLHHACLDPWRAAWRREAITALKKMDIGG